MSPPRFAFTRRVIHLNFDVASSGETFVSQLLNTWSGMCDVKWLLDRIVQLLREPEPDLVPAAARPENALARDGDEDGDGGIDDEAGARGTQPLGNDLRVKRQADRLAAELFRLHRDRPRRYKALARQHALQDLEERSRARGARRVTTTRAPRAAAGGAPRTRTRHVARGRRAAARAKSDKRSVVSPRKGGRGSTCSARRRGYVHAAGVPAEDSRATPGREISTSYSRFLVLHGGPRRRGRVLPAGSRRCRSR